MGNITPQTGPQRIAPQVEVIKMITQRPMKAKRRCRGGSKISPWQFQYKF